jgi:hypothetical protein
VHSRFRGFSRGEPDEIPAGSRPAHLLKTGTEGGYCGRLVGEKVGNLTIHYDRIVCGRISKGFYKQRLLLVVKRLCKGISKGGERCPTAPLSDSDYCFFHDPEHQQEAAEARRLGGLRRKRESTLQGAYDLESLDSVAGIRRYLEVGLIDLMGLENSVARNRALFTGVLAAAKLLEVGELEARLEAVEAALGPRLPDVKRRT